MEQQYFYDRFTWQGCNHEYSICVNEGGEIYNRCEIYKYHSNELVDNWRKPISYKEAEILLRNFSSPRQYREFKQLFEGGSGNGTSTQGGNATGGGNNGNSSPLDELTATLLTASQD